MESGTPEKLEIEERNPEKEGVTERESSKVSIYILPKSLVDS